MNIALIGGMDRRKREYENFGKKYGSELKSYSGKESNLAHRIGQPEAILLVTSMVSHKARQQVLQQGKSYGIPVIFTHKKGFTSICDRIQHMTKSTK